MNVKQSAKTIIAGSIFLSVFITAEGTGLRQKIDFLTQDLDESSVPTGILYNRAVPLSGIERYDGSDSAPTITSAGWYQVYHELKYAELSPSALPEVSSLKERGKIESRQNLFSLAVIHKDYNRFATGAEEDGRISLTASGTLSLSPGSLEIQSAIVFSAIKGHTYRGHSTQFIVPSELYFSNQKFPQYIEIDFDDGRGFVSISLDEIVPVSYTEVGFKNLKMRMISESETASAGATFEVRSLDIRQPDTTWTVTADTSYSGIVASGEAFIYFAEGRSEIQHPVILIEGFDISDDMDQDELYDLANQEALFDDLEASGFDGIILNFDDPTTYIQDNAIMFQKLLDMVNPFIAGEAETVVVGASLGGLVGRIALVSMERDSIDHNVRTFISFDAPHYGANVPLGLQYFANFFGADESSLEMSEFIDALNSPGSRQLLRYHFTEPTSDTYTAPAEPDSLHTLFIQELDSLGMPENLRTVAVSNGSASGATQGFSPGEQIIDYYYWSFLVEIRGDVYAVQNTSSQLVLDGLMDLLFPLPDSDQTVTVHSAEPIDAAPGGYRMSMHQMDTTSGNPWGDIVALYDAHCFIPTASGLGIEPDDILEDLTQNVGQLASSMFDTIYYPLVNEDHVSLSAESKIWFMNEIGSPEILSVENHSPIAEAFNLHLAYPNPFNPSTTIRFDVGLGEAIMHPFQLTIYDITGRLVEALVDGELHSGSHEVIWNADRFASGVYFAYLKSNGLTQTQKITLLK